MIFKHSFSAEQVCQLHENSELWEELNVYFVNEMDYKTEKEDVGWNRQPTGNVLYDYWSKLENREEPDYLYIENDYCRIEVYRYIIRIWFMRIFYDYGFLMYSWLAVHVIKVGRIFAHHWGASKVLYIPDSNVDASKLVDYIDTGMSLDEIIEKGVELFGPIPRGISKGRKNYFFVDYIQQDIGNIKKWDDEEIFLKWDEDKRKFIRLNGASM